MSKALRNRISLPFMLSLSLGTMGCLEPTQVEVEIWTDEPCENINGVAVFTGVPGQFESKAASSTGLQQACTETPGPDSPAPRRLGNVVIVPSGAKDADVGIKVAVGVNRNAEECLIPEGQDESKADVRVTAFRNCIVARRALKFQKNATLKVPIVLRSSCKNIGCTADTTCVLGECRPYKFDSEESCASPEGCSESGLPTAIEEASGCGRPSVFSDRFGADLKEGETYDPGKTWSVPIGTEAQAAGGRLVFKAPATPEAFYTTRYAVDLNEDVFRVQVPEAFSDKSGAATVFKVHSGDGLHWMRIEKKADRIVFSTSFDDPQNPSFDDSYKSVDHLWWAIRDIKNPSTGSHLIEMQTSADGLDWFKKRSFPRPDFAKAVHASLGVEAGPNQVASDTSQFAYFNTEKKSLGWCKADTLVDEFKTVGMQPFSMQPLWTINQSEPSFITTHNGDSITLDMAGMPVSSQFNYTSEQAFDMTNSTVTMRLSDTTIFSKNSEVFIGVITGAKTKLRWILKTTVTNTPVFCKLLLKDVMMAYAPCTPIDNMTPMMGEYTLRIRHQDDVILWQASSDGGKTFRDLSSDLLLADDPSLNLKEVQIVFGIETIKFQNGDPLPTITVESINSSM